MSVYIKGMEMPKDGFITVTITSDGRVVGNSKRESDKFEYLDNKDIATAIHVPDHGDLIDRDKLREKEFINDGDAYAVVMSRDIRNAPTIIPAEEGQ